jgi:hypothetical protein
MKLVGDQGGMPQSGIPVIVSTRAGDLSVFSRLDYLTAIAANASVTFTDTPFVSQGTPLKIWKNGSLLFYGVDYTLSANKATFTALLAIGDKIVAEYWAISMQGASTLTGVRTYDTWNPSDKNTTITLSNSNKSAADNANSNWGIGRGITGISTGKVYVEGTVDVIGSGNSNAIGIANSSAIIASPQYLGQVTNTSFGFFLTRGATPQKAVSNVFTNLSFTNFVVTDKFMLAWDAGAKQLWIGKNGTWNGSGNPSTGANPDITYTQTGTFFLATSAINLSKLTLNAGASAFTYTVPTGFNIGLYVDT